MCAPLFDWHISTLPFEFNGPWLPRFSHGKRASCPMLDTGLCPSGSVCHLVGRPVSLQRSDAVMGSLIFKGIFVGQKRFLVDTVKTKGNHNYISKRKRRGTTTREPCNLSQNPSRFQQNRGPPSLLLHQQFDVNRAVIRNLGSNYRRFSSTFSGMGEANDHQSR